MLESIISPDNAEKHPWKLFFIGFIYASVALFLSLWIFKQYASLVAVFLTVLASVFLVHRTLKLEEKKDIALKEETSMLREHAKALFFLVFLFLGFVVAFSFWYLVLPADTVQVAFESQISTIASINKFTSSAISGNSVSSGTLLLKIFFNNFKVLFFCILLAFFYGAGVTFILVWNASVIGAAIGNFVRSSIAQITAQLGFASLSHYFSIYSLGLLRYLTHGVFEILAYFTAALAAGIISIAVINHDYKSPKFIKVIKDSSSLLILSVIVLVIAALIEVYITPLMF